MAVTASMRRMVGLELVENVTALKAAVDAINTVVSGWTLDDEDSALPTAADVKAELAAYDAVAKPSNSINDALAEIRAYTET